MQSFLQFLHTVMSQLQPFIQRARATLESLLASPDRWIVYVAAVWIALLLIFIPLMRISARRRRRREELEDVPSYSVLGIGPTSNPVHADADDLIRPLHSSPRWAEATPLAERPLFRSAPNVMPIRRSTVVKCTHCGGALSAHQDFCPACGYAQPMDQSVTA